MKHVPFKAALASFLMAGTIYSSPAVAEEAAGSGPKNPAHVEITIKPGNTRSIGEADLFIPLFQDTMRMFFADFRVVRDTLKNTEGNFGLGYRHIMNNRYILGVYGFFDIRRSRFHNTFTQATFGAEVLSCNFDARVNVYIPTSTKKKTVKRPTYTGFVGNYMGTISNYKQQFESALTGFDAEIGAKVPTPGFKNLELKVFGGGYYFAKRHGMHHIAGPRGRVEAQFNDVFTPGSRITVGFEVSNDKRVFKANQSSKSRTHFFGQLGIRIPLQWKSMRVATGLQRRLAEYVYRDVDIVTGASNGGKLAAGDVNRLVHSAVGGAGGLGTTGTAGTAGNFVKVHHVNATVAAANGVAAANRDGTFEKPFATDKERQDFLALAANAAINNYSDYGVALSGQNNPIASTIQYDAIAANNQRSTFYILGAGGPDTITGMLATVSVKNGVVTKVANKAAFAGNWIQGTTGATRPSVTGPATGGIFGTNGLNLVWNGVDATAGANAAPVVNFNANVQGGNVSANITSANFTGNGTSAQAINLAASNATTAAVNLKTVNVTGFTAGTGTVGVVNDTSTLTFVGDAVTYTGNNVGLNFTGNTNSVNPSKLNVTTQGKSAINNSVTNGVVGNVNGNTTAVFNFNDTTVNGTTGPGAIVAGLANAANGAGIVIYNTSGAAGTSTTAFNANGLVVSNCNGHGVYIDNVVGGAPVGGVASVGGAETGNTTFNVTNSTFTGNGKGGGANSNGRGFYITLFGGTAANNTSNAKVTGTFTGNTFSGNAASGFYFDASSNAQNNALTLTGDKFTGNNTGNTAVPTPTLGEAEVVLITADNPFTSAQAQNLNLTNCIIDGVVNNANATGIIVNAAGAANARLNLTLSGTAIASAAGGLGTGMIIVGTNNGVAAPANPAVNSAVVNIVAGTVATQISGFTAGTGIVGYSDVITTAVNTNIGTSAVLNIATGVTNGNGANGFLVTNNNIGINAQGALAFSGNLVNAHLLGINVAGVSFTGTWPATTPNSTLLFAVNNTTANLRHN